MPRIRKYTDQEFTDIVSKSFSVRSALKALGLRPTGGNYASFYNRCKNLSIDYSHFSGKFWNKGKKFAHKKELKEYFENKSSITSHRLRLRLISEGIKSSSCEMCGLSEWLGGPIPLELDHINGISNDNRLENLRILCPNCHYLTPTYRGKNWGIRSKA